MSKNCRIEFVDGELVCLCNHHNYNNCDLYIAEYGRDEKSAEENGVDLETYYGVDE